MIIKNIDSIEEVDVEFEEAKNVKKKLAIGTQDGTPTMSFRVFTLDKDGYTPYHSHEQEHINYIIEGAGFLIDAAGNKHKVKQGDFVLVKPFEKHQYRNEAEEKFVMICAVKKEYE